MEHILTKRTLVIIPCYNEAKRLPAERFSEFIKNSETVDFLFVDDGSTDGTAAMLEKLCATSNSFSFLHTRQTFISNHSLELLDIHPCYKQQLQ